MDFELNLVIIPLPKLGKGKNITMSQTSVLDRFSPYLLLTLTTLFWAGNFNVGRALNGVVPPLGLSFWRWFIAWLILLPFAWQAMYQQFTVFKQHWRLIVALSFFGITCFNSLVYLGLQTTTATNGVLLQSVNPILIILLASLFLQEKTTLQQWFGVILSLLGVLIILAHGDWQVLQQFAFKQGDLIILAAVLSWSIYTVLLRKLPNALKGLPILGYTLTLGMLMILPFYLVETWQGRPMPLTWISVSGVAYVALLPSLMAYWFWNHATHKIGASRTGQFTHLIPVFGILIATLVLGEQLHLFHLAGSLLVALGLVLTNVQWKRRTTIN